MPRRRRFPNDRSSASAARRFVLDALTPEVSDGFVDTTVLLTNELVTNALLHGRSGMEVTIEVTPGIVRVEVLDDSRVLPARKHYGLQTTTGRGLHLLDALATAWGAEPTPDGKRVWFEIDRISPGPAVIDDEPCSRTEPAAADTADREALAACFLAHAENDADDADGTGMPVSQAPRRLRPARPGLKRPRRATTVVPGQMAAGGNGDHRGG